tara:strand:- start:2813 stop:4306 length:1494 start_codon:yes stop_codon:yes gene_type:complete
MPRLRFHDDQGDLKFFSRPYSEQVDFLNALSDPTIKTIVVLKPRQIGQSTANCGHTFFKTFTARKALRTLVVTDCNKSTDSLYDKFQTYYDTLPRQFQDANPIRFNKTKKNLMSDRTGALIDTLTASGKAEGRAWTYQRFVAEELAKWPDAESMFASLRSAFHQGPEFKTIIISTARGPGNLFHKKVIAAQEAQRIGDPSVKLLFSRWCDHRTYQSPPPPWWEPTAEDQELAQVFGLNLAQLYWRHNMIHGVDGIGERMFLQEFPLTVEEGFMRNDGAWFDGQVLSTRFAELPKELIGELRTYRQPEKNVGYVIGVDPSWCTGGDFAVACVLNEYGEQCAVLSHKSGGTKRFADELSILAHKYKALVLCEGNTGGGGRVVIDILRQDGVRLWRPKDGKEFWNTSKGNKEMAYSHARQITNADYMELNDHQTIQELMHIREENGKIEGKDGHHDDHSTAYVLACQALKRVASFQTTQYERPRLARNRTPLDVVMGYGV